MTICSYQWQEIFGEIAVGATRGSPVMALNKYGEIVRNIWHTIPDHHPVALDAFQMMPNHIHFIIQLLGNRSGGSRPAPTLGIVVGLFKSECTKQIRRAMGDANKIIWQRNYYEHIIKTEESLNQTREYIVKNLISWEFDCNNPLNIYGKIQSSKNRTQVAKTVGEGGLEPGPGF